MSTPVLITALGELKITTTTTKDFLHEAVPIHLNITKSTMAQQIIKTIAVHYGETISYKAELSSSSHEWRSRHVLF